MRALQRKLVASPSPTADSKVPEDISIGARHKAEHFHKTQRALGCFSTWYGCNKLCSLQMNRTKNKELENREVQVEGPSLQFCFVSFPLPSIGSPPQKKERKRSPICMNKRHALRPHYTNRTPMLRNILSMSLESERLCSGRFCSSYFYLSFWPSQTKTRSNAEGTCFAACPYGRLRSMPKPTLSLALHARL